jgi:hypothetical protein
MSISLSGFLLSSSSSLLLLRRRKCQREGLGQHERRHWERERVPVVLVVVLVEVVSRLACTDSARGGEGGLGRAAVLLVEEAEHVRRGHRE